MTKYREILRLASLGLSQQDIADSFSRIWNQPERTGLRSVVNLLP